MPGTLHNRDWEFLLGRIQQGRCTPFLGAGACADVLPLGEDIAEEWAQQYDYPLEDRKDLTRVAQFLAVQFDQWLPKQHLVDLVQKCEPPDFTAPDEPHAVLARLPLPIYLTTNYDDFMVQALRREQRDPRREICCWNKKLEDLVAASDDFTHDLEGLDPDDEHPLVFHIHGCEGLKESIVVTEDDYLQFLAGASNNRDMTPARIRQALSETTLLFVGYSLRDWTFRVLWRSLVASRPDMRYLSVAIQLPPDPNVDSAKEQQDVQEFLDRYFDKLFAVRVYWGTAREFAADLSERWGGFEGE